MADIVDQTRKQIKTMPMECTLLYNKTNSNIANFPSKFSATKLIADRKSPG